MGILIRKNHQIIFFTRMAKLAFVLLLVSMSSSFVDTIWAVYLESFLHNTSLVGFFSGALSVLSFISFFLLVPFVAKSRKSVLYSTSLILLALFYFLVGINKNFVLFAIFSFFITILFTLRITSFGIILRDKSNSKYLSRNEGLMYTFSNVAWVIGPLLAGFIFVKGSISLVFIFASLFLLLAFLFFKFSEIYDGNLVRHHSPDIFRNFLIFFKNHDMRIAYLLGMGVTFWWALIYLYMPLYILQSNLDKTWIGIFLFLVAIPLIIFEYPASKFGGKHGFRLLFKTGYFILFLTPLVIFFINNIFVVFSLLILASFGIAMIEPTTEAYFFDILKNKKDTNKFYGPYNTAIEAGLITGKLIPAAFLIFLPFKYVFLIFSLSMLIFFAVSFKAKKVVEMRKKG